MGAKTSTEVGFKPRPPGTDSVTSTDVLTTRLSEFCHPVSNNRFCLNNKLNFGVRAIEISKKNQEEAREKVT